MDFCLTGEGTIALLPFLLLDNVTASYSLIVKFVFVLD